MEMKKPLLTISLLASNRMDTLPRCLDSLRPIMEVIPSELILIDTSKNPEVNALLKTYTEQVYEFEWCKDFAKARNEGLLRAKGEWFLYLDDDEWFAEADALIQFFQSGEYKQYGYANYRVRNFLDVKYTNYSDCWVSRMIRVDEDTRFVSKIHEYFTPLRGARKDLDVLVHHSGYIYDTPEKKRAHFERNMTLLKEMIAEEPENIRWKTQLAQEYSSMGEWETLESYCRNCLESTAYLETPYERIHSGTFHAGLVYALLYQKKYDLCIQACEQALADSRCTEVLEALMYLKMGEVYFRLGDFEKAEKYAQIYIQKGLEIQHEAPHIREQKIALIVGEAFDDNKWKEAYGILICSDLEKGHTDVLNKHYEKLGWNQQVIYVLENIETYLVKAMWEMPYEPLFTRIIVDAFQNRELRSLFCREMIIRNVDSSAAHNEFQKILSSFAESMQALVAGPKFWDLISYHNTMQAYVQAAVQWYDFAQLEELPDYIQAAVKINEYIQLETENKVQALGLLKEAVDIFPEFADGIGRFLHSYTELEKQRAEHQKKEMEALRLQVIEQVKAMLANEQKDVALQILGQLKQMFPEDLEVAALALEVRVK